MLFVITKTKHLRIGSNNEHDVPNCSRNIDKQTNGNHHGTGNGDHEVNAMVEENVDIDMIHNYDGINILINDTFHASSMDDDFDEYVEDVPLIEKA